MSANSLKDELSAGSGVVETLKNSPYRPMVFPVAAEFTNWRSEQHAWRDSVALLDQSHHMTDLFISGPDAAAMLERLAVNTFKNFGVDKAKQMVSVNARASSSAMRSSSTSARTNTISSATPCSSTGSTSMPRPATGM